MRTRIICLFIKLILPVCFCYSNPIGVERARCNAAMFLDANQTSNTIRKLSKQASTLELVYEGKAADIDYPLFYIFKRPARSGYIIAAGDDCINNILGYSNNGSIDIDNMPCNMRWWLDEYVKIITYCSKNNIRIDVHNSSSDIIEPLLTCRWGQWDPYNRFCPIGSNGKRCPTGCSPTALAQVMYYHKWPKQGTGSFSYNFEMEGIGTKTLSADFGSTQYDWNNMRDVEDAANASDAVGILMHHIGVAMEVRYGTSGSGIIYKKEESVLIKYFSYYANHVEASSLTRDSLVTLLLNELHHKRPVYYCGGNHAFVLDGYKDGYYHFNWGWDGDYDGYYLLSDLKPAGMDFTGSHRFVCEIQPYYGDTMASIEVNIPGTLRNVIGMPRMFMVESLKISGKLNGSDILTLREMAGRDIDNNQTKGCLVELDLSEAKIVNGGDCYFKAPNSYYETQYGTKENVFPVEGFMNTQLQSIKLPNSIKSVGTYSFVFCYNLQKIDFGKSVTEFEFSCFNYTSFPEVIIPNQITNIGPYAFCNISSLKRLVLSPQIQSIGYRAFEKDDNIKEIISKIEEPFNIREDVFSSSCFENAILKVPLGKVSKYKKIDGWKNFKHIVGIGDVNGDLAIDVADIANVIDVMAKGGNDVVADVNGDGKVDVADIAYIIDIMTENSN